MDANELRAAFTGYFMERGHTLVPSDSLIPHDPTILFTIAGMVPFKPYLLGEEPAPWPRATSVQKCFRTPDLDIVGTTSRHGTFFEMLGNFSFGDYFKERAIPYAWELVTEVLGLEPDRLWVTVHESDDEAEGIWRDAVGVPRARIQRMGEDNFWSMGDTGPCGPSSELYVDRGERFGPEGGPKHGGDERYVEIWNLVFMQLERHDDGSLTELPRRNIDTGAGLDRVLAVVQGVDSLFETDLMVPLIEKAQSLTGRHYGRDQRDDVALRILADHGRAMTMVVVDGVLPSNEGRGYVLRRLIRRAVLAARRLGVDQTVTAALAETTAEIMGQAYPAVASSLGLAQEVLEREEQGFDRTLRSGLNLLEEAWKGARSRGADQVSGDVAFRLHDTHGFPIELTVELSGEAGLAVDRPGFDEAMAEQRERARRAARTPVVADERAYRELVDRVGPTPFVGRDRSTYEIPTTVTAVLAGDQPEHAEIFLERTPFYAEGGGQVGDVGTIVTETGRARVLDTQPAAAGLISHRAVIEGEILPGQDALAAIDVGRREATRRNHTGTHLLHAALRQVVGDHVRQQGSEVAPDRLRFDFSHHAPLTKDEVGGVLEVANADVLTDAAVVTTETSRREAEAMGALAYFGDKYGDRVRVVRAGPHSLEFRGGTHVDALGAIGPVSIVSEGSIGANTRRLLAVTGAASVERGLKRDALIEDAANLLRTEPDGLLDALERLLDRQKAADREVQRLRAASAEQDAVTLAAQLEDGVVIGRRDGVPPDELRSLAQAVRRQSGADAVVLGGSPDGAKATLVVATGGEPDATVLVRELASVVGGGGGGSAEVAVAGGRNPEQIDAALDQGRRILVGR